MSRPTSVPAQDTANGKSQAANVDAGTIDEVLDVEQHGTLRDAWGVGQIRALLLARAVSEFGTGATTATLLLTLAAWTGSARDVSLNAIAQAAPSIIVGWLAGAIADRYDRRLVCIFSDLVRCVGVLAFIFVPRGDIGLILGITAFQATVGSFFMPASSALAPQIVEKRLRASALGAMQSSMMLADLVGVSMAGVLISSFGNHHVAFIVDSASFAVAALLISRATTTGEPAVRTEQRTMRAVLEGLRFISTTPLIAATVAASVLSMLVFSAVNVLHIPLLIDVIRASPAWIGPISACFVGSAVALSLCTRQLAQRLRPVGMVVTGLAVAGTGVIVMSTARVPIVLCGTAILMGAAQTLIGAGGSLIAQNNVEDRLRGRVASAVISMSDAASILALVTVSVFATTLGTRELLVVGALVVTAGTVPIALLYARASSPRRGET